MAYLACGPGEEEFDNLGVCCEEEEEEEEESDVEDTSSSCTTLPFSVRSSVLSSSVLNSTSEARSAGALRATGNTCK